MRFHYDMSMAQKGPRTRATGTRRRRKPAGTSIGLTAAELQAAAPTSEVADLHRAIDSDGGRVLAVYREPYGGRWVLFAALPIDRVAATPYQRNLSDAHVRRLEAVIGKIGRFLDPIIVVRAQDPTGEQQAYWTPNGHHRLSALRTLGAKSIVAIVVPEPQVAYQILALNTEKAHNLREKALEVIRLYREFARLGDLAEESCSLEFEDPAFITLGLCYEQRPRFSGGAYHPVLKRVDQFLGRPCREALAIRERRAQALLRLDDVVLQKVEALKARGLTSPYLKSFVVARINPVRFRPKEAPPLSFEEAMDRMMKAAEKLNTEKVKTEDLARSGGPPDEPE